jgi:uncharacterized protein Yka (UPF0111/DUF47 family)
MKFSNVLQYFIPKEKKFYGMFNQVAENIIEAASEFEKLINTPAKEDRKAIGLRIKALERKGDDLATMIFDELHQTFITPFDREDIQELASTMDDVVDLIYGATGKIDLYNCTIFSQHMKEMVALISKGCLHVHVAVKGLENMRNSDVIKKACKDINKIESQVDGFYHQAISLFFDTVKNHIATNKKKFFRKSQTLPISSKIFRMLSRPS